MLKLIENCKFYDILKLRAFLKIYMPEVKKLFNNSILTHYISVKFCMWPINDTTIGSLKYKFAGKTLVVEMTEIFTSSWGSKTFFFLFFSFLCHFVSALCRMLLEMRIEVDRQVKVLPFHSFQFQETK